MNLLLLPELTIYLVSHANAVWNLMGYQLDVIFENLNLCVGKLNACVHFRIPDGERLFSLPGSVVPLVLLDG